MDMPKTCKDSILYGQGKGMAIQNKPKKEEIIEEN
jgi:hypothetical protein